MTLGERLRDYREVRQWTQDQLSARSGVGQSLISELEAGKRERPSADVIRRLARALQVTMEQLMEGEHYEEEAPAGIAVMDIPTMPDGSTDHTLA